MADDGNLLGMPQRYGPFNFVVNSKAISKKTAQEEGWNLFLDPKNKEKWARICLAVGLLVWFFLDTAISLSHKVYFNAIFNVGVLILAMLPVICTKKDFA